jgi:hypothetical protein
MRCALAQAYRYLVALTVVDAYVVAYSYALKYVLAHLIAPAHAHAFV